MAQSLLSPSASRLLLLLVPERVPIREQSCDNGAVMELDRLGIVVLEGYGSTRTIRLTALGRGMGNPAFNN